MKKKQIYSLLIIFTFTILSTRAYCQVFVYDITLDSIEQQVMMNPEYLISLNQKFIYSDSVLTVNDYFDLYYGSAYLKGYSPYAEVNSTRTTFELLEKGMFKEVIELCENQIKSNPGFVRPFYFLGIAYNRLGDTTTSQIFFNRFYNYLSIPYASGNGNSTDSAIIVRSIDDEYLIVGELDLQIVKQALIFEDNIPYDILYVRSESDSLSREMYFNITQPYLLGLNVSEDNEKTTKKDKNKKRKKKNKKVKK